MDNIQHSSGLNPQNKEREVKKEERGREKKRENKGT